MTTQFITKRRLIFKIMAKAGLTILAWLVIFAVIRFAAMFIFGLLS
jgi:hypothetical protein